MMCWSGLLAMRAECRNLDSVHGQPLDGYPCGRVAQIASWAARQEHVVVSMRIDFFSFD